MKTIDIKKILENAKLDPSEVAPHLFPDNKYPRLALNRVMAGEALLDSAQLSKLAAMANITMSDLFSESNWKGGASEGKLILYNGDYKAELDTRTYITKIFHRGSLFHEKILHKRTIPLSEYLTMLDNAITNKSL